MTVLSRDTAKTALINGLRYPLAAPVERSQLATYIRKFTVGDAQYDSDDYQSALILANFSGGIGIEDSDEGADTTRFWFAVMDSRSPRMLALPPLVTQTKPSGASGTARPLGVIGTQFYCCFANVAYGWDDSSDDWHSTANDLNYDPVNKPVNFDGNVWIPQGANGIRSVTETTAGTGTLTEANITSSPKAVSLAIWANRLYALTTDGYLYYLVQGSTSWTQVANSAGTNLRINTGDTPKTLIAYADRSGAPALWAITDRAAYLFYESEVEWVPSNIKFPSHPDFGRAASVWRTGEDLWISAASDIVRQTTGNAIVPMASGISRDQGLPQEYRGTIYDLEPEISNLYALVGGTSTSSTSWTYDSAFGSAGSGNSEFSDIRQIAIDSSGNIYAADYGNDRVQKFNSSGAHQSNLITSVDEVQGIAVDDLGNLYLTFKNGSSDYRIRKYNSSGTLQWTSATASTTALGHLASFTYLGTRYVCVTRPATEDALILDTSTGALGLTIGSSGTGDGQFSDPYGIAYNSITGTLFVVDQGNDRVQEFTASGAFVRKWGSSGTADGQFTTPWAVACNAVNGNVYVTDIGRDDVQEFTATGTFVRKFGSAGSGNGQFGSSQGIALNAAATALWASDADNEDIQKFTLATSTSTQTAYPTLHAWPGTGWHCLWKGSDNTDIPTWAIVSAPTTHYRLWWGMDDGNAYYTTLYRGFENVNQARIAETAYFAASGFLLSSKFDAGMLGFRKLASHVVVIPVEDSITSTETIVIEFSIDEGGWETLGTLNSTTLDSDTNEARFSFGASGRKFNTIRFRLTGARGSTTTRSPLLRSLTLLFNKIPPPARSLIFTIAPGAGDAGMFGRDAFTMFQELDDLAVADEFFDVEYNGLTFSHCRLASVTGQDGISENAGRRVVSVIELPTGIAA